MDDEENNINKKGNYQKTKSQKPFVIYDEFNFILKFYDKNGNKINELSHKDYIFDKCQIFKFKKNLLILKFNYKLLFVKYSLDRKQC